LVSLHAGVNVSHPAPTFTHCRTTGVSLLCRVASNCCARDTFPSCSQHFTHPLTFRACGPHLSFARPAQPLISNQLQCPCNQVVHITICMVEKDWPMWTSLGSPCNAVGHISIVETTRPMWTALLYIFARPCNEVVHSAKSLSFLEKNLTAQPAHFARYCS
jgi:hypothetical protein